MHALMEQVASNRVVAVGLLPFDMNKSSLIIVETDLLLFSEWHFTTIPDGKNVVTRMIADTEGCLSFDLSHIVSQGDFCFPWRTLAASGLIVASSGASSDNSVLRERRSDPSVCCRPTRLACR